MYQQIKRPSELQACVVNIFLHGIKPAWEVPEHAQGGEWVIKVNKDHSNLIWENLVLGFIGEQFSIDKEVTGVVLNIGNQNYQDKISVWFRNADNKKVQQQIRQDIIRILELTQEPLMSFTLFHEAQKPKAGKDRAERELKPFA